MRDKMFKIAKEKDDGRFAKLGMKEYCASFFDVDVTSEAVLYIVDTYLECINDIDFDEWIAGNYTSRPMIYTKNDLKNLYSDLTYISKDLKEITNLFMYFYNQDFYVDELNDYIYTTTFNLKNRQRIDSLGIRLEIERLITLHEKEILTEKDVESCIEVLNQYGYDIEKDYDIRNPDIYIMASNIEERMNQVIGGIL